MPTSYTRLAIENLDAFVYGRAPRPVRLKNGLAIGEGTVHPGLEVHPAPLAIEEGTMPEVRDQYRRIISTGACRRAVELHLPALVEFELLPEMTLVPEWGAGFVSLLKEALAKPRRRTGS